MSNESEREAEEALARQRRELEEREAQARRREWEERQRELEEIPPTPIDKSKWPKGVRPLSLDEDALGVDAKANLYWHGKPVETRTRVDLDWWQTAIAVVIAVGTLIGAGAAVAQGWAAYNDWACKVGWPAVCPRS
jgi:hypothetical protein